MINDNDKHSATIAGLAVFLSVALLIIMIRVAVEATGTQKGQYRYKMAPKSSLIPIEEGSAIKLRKSAARAFKNMQQAAKLEGIKLNPLSGYRNVKEQKLLNDNSNEARQSQICMSRHPSEHHTGYSVDIGDSEHFELNKLANFIHSTSFKWLKKNAQRFHFEMSATNEKDVGVEAWHWRYIGDLKSFRTFYRSKSSITYASMFFIP